MNIKLILFFFIIFILFNNIYITESVSPPINEYQCVESFINKFNFTNYFKKNSTGYYQICDTSSLCYSNGSIYTFYAIADSEVITPGAQVVLKDLDCIPYVNTLYLRSLTISNEFLYNKLPYVTTISLPYVTLLNPISQILPSYSSFYIISSQLEGSTLNLSYLNNLNRFTIDNNYIYLVRDDGATTDKLKNIKLRTHTLPNLDGYIFDIVTLDFPAVMNLAELDNFQFIKSTEVSFSFFNLVVPPYFLSNKYISSLKHSGSFQQATQIYDISVGYNYTSIQLQSVSKLFFYSNQVPLKLNSNQNLNFYAGPISDATISTVIPSPNSIGYLKTLEVSYSSLTGDFPIYNGSGLAYDFSNNKITGTINKSWCGTNLILINNQLTGTIPSCFTCHFNSTLSTNLKAYGSQYFVFRDFYSSFSGNSFSNYDKSLPCTTLAPQIKSYNDTSFIIYGTDIGFDPHNFYINSSTPCVSNPSAIINYGFEYYCNTGKSLKGVSYLSIRFRYVDTTDRVLYFPLISHPPVFSSINITGNTILFEGSYFSSYIGHSNQTITLNGYNCTIESTSFFKISCISTASLPISTTDSSLITLVNGNQTKKVYIDTTDGFINNKVCVNDCINNSTHGEICDKSNGECRGIECLNSCSGNGECNKIYGTCTCNSNFQSADCSIPLKKCPMDPDGDECWGRGLCLNTTGTCDCNNGYTLNDCSGYVCDDPTCGNGNGQCQYTTGECLCKNEWSGANCLVTIHYISSVIPSNETGGTASFIGFFAYIHDSLTITIGDKDCKPTYKSSDIINCTAPAGTGIHNVNITQNGITFIGYNIYRYNEIQVENDNQNCANNCSNHGICNAGNICQCSDGYSSYDCSSISNNNNNQQSIPSETEVDENTGSITITNEKTNFKIYIRSLYEVDIMGKTIKTYQLNSDWSVNKQSSNIYSFIQQFDEGFIINSTIETITLEDGKEFSFAGTDFKLDKDSTKFTISISNYTYQSFLNTLKLEFISSANDTYEENEDNCNKKETSIESNNQYDFNYIKIEKNNKIMIGKFINKVLSDSKPTYLSSNISKEGKTLVYTINLPHFTKSCTIDPDFSVLLSSDFSSCDSPDENNKWKIPVAIIVPVCVAGSLAFIAFRIRKRSFIRFNGKIIKLNQLNNINKQ